MHSPELYQFSFYSVPNIIVSTIIFAVGLFVFIQNVRRASNVYFFLFCISLNLWLYGRAWMYCTLDAEHALWIARRFAFLGVAYIAPLVYAFSVYWLHREKAQKYFVLAGLYAAPCFYLGFNLTTYGIASVHKHFWGFYPVYGWLGKVYLCFFFGYFLAAFYNFFSELKIVEDGARKKQVRLMTIAFLISCTASWDYIPKVIPVSLYPFGFLLVLIWVLMVGYCIVKYRALDIQTAIHKTMIWFVSTAIAMVPFVLVLYFSDNWMRTAPKGFVTAYLLTLLVTFYFYFQYLYPKLGQLLKLRSANLDRILETFARRLTHLNNLTSLLQRFVRTLRRTVYVEKVAVFLLDSSRKQLVPAIVKGNRRLKSIDLKSPYMQWLEKKNAVVVKDLVLTDPQIASFREDLQKHLDELNIKVVVPFVLSGKLIGLAYLGPKENFRRFTSLEIGFLSALKVPMTIALSNSMRLEDVSKLYKELQTLNEELEARVEARTKELVETQGQLIQAEKMATLGTMAGGVAHEINNPLTAVLTNAQILKMTASADDMELIDLIEQGAKRCQSITKNLLKYSRKEKDTTIFEKVDLNASVRNVVNFLEYQLKQDNVEIRSKYCCENLFIDGKKNEIEQVLTNLIINAKDAVLSNSSKKLIDIITSVRVGSAVIGVADNGVGIDEKDIRKIFDPFFTKKDVGEGTGLGLSVSYGIVQKHNGSIAVKSTLGVGSTFEVVLPLTSHDLSDSRRDDE